MTALNFWNSHPFLSWLQQLPEERERVNLPRGAQTTKKCQGFYLYLLNLKQKSLGYTYALSQCKLKHKPTFFILSWERVEPNKDKDNDKKDFNHSPLNPKLEKLLFGIVLSSQILQIRNQKKIWMVSIIFYIVNFFYLNKQIFKQTRLHSHI